TQFTLDHYSESVYWFTIPEYRVIDVNPAACIALGYNREEFLNMTLVDIDARFSVEKLDALWNELNKTKSSTIESIHRKKNGDEFPVEIIANLIEFEGNVYVVAFARDISTRKAAEALLHKSEQEYRKIFENVADIFFEVSLDGKLLNITPSVKHITKYRQRDLIGQPMEVFYYDPVIREQLLKALYEKGEILNYELDAKDKDGSPVPCSLNAKIIFDEGGKPERIVGSLSDIRHRKKAEKQIHQLSTALQQSPVSVIILDPDTKILYVNDSFIQFSGMDEAEIIGNTPFEITRGQIPLINLKSEMWAAVLNGEIWKGEMEYTKRDGSKVWLSATVSPVLDEQEQASNFVVFLEVITERKIAEQNLRKAKDEAEKSDYLKSAFLANMSHE
ncbi:MAG: PAS domain S-box protein, partial [Bacteroidales bacterium]|nr:PAS domain S-box protein [Bacteroidales bacterium]